MKIHILLETSCLLLFPFTAQFALAAGVLAPNQDTDRRSRISKAHCVYRRLAPTLIQLALAHSLSNGHFLAIHYVAAETKIPHKEISEFSLDFEGPLRRRVSA